jgi:hypothetical protein
VQRTETQAFKVRALSRLPKGTGVYALCDLDEVPIYVGQSTDGINARVRRHLTSARSDVIANRQIDVWEIAFVWAWELEVKRAITELETKVFHACNDTSPLVNGKVPPRLKGIRKKLWEPIRIQVMSDVEIEARREPAARFPRQIQHFGSLVDYILNTQDKPHLRRAIEVHFERLRRYHEAFAGGAPRQASTKA